MDTESGFMTTRYFVHEGSSEDSLSPVRRALRPFVWGPVRPMVAFEQGKPLIPIAEVGAGREFRE